MLSCYLNKIWNIGDSFFRYLVSGIEMYVDDSYLILAESNPKIAC